MYNNFLSKELYGKGSYKKYGKYMNDEMDLAKILRELHGLRVLNRVYFKDAHLLLMPEIVHKLKLEETDENEEGGLRDRAKGKPGAKREPGSSHNFELSKEKTSLKKGLTRGMTFKNTSKNEREEAIQMIKHDYERAITQPERALNQFFLQNLAPIELGSDLPIDPSPLDLDLNNNPNQELYRVNPEHLYPSTTFSADKMQMKSHHSPQPHPRRRKSVKISRSNIFLESKGDK